MPINYKDYPSDWKEISHFIRFTRADNKCERCGVKNGDIGYRGKNNGKWYPIQLVEAMLDQFGYDYFEHELSHYLKANGELKRQPTKIVLTVAHYDQTKTNNKYVTDSWQIKDLEKNNLFAWCQSCHLRHDMNQHVENRKKNRESKSKQLTLF